MGQSVINTSNPYTKLICNHSSELIGNYPGITFRIHYNFQVQLTAAGSWYWNGMDIWFHTVHHSVNLNCSYGRGGGTTGVLASGYIDLPIYGQSTSHAPGCGCGGPFSGSGTITETQTIPNGSLTSNLVSYTHDSCVINVAMNSPRNYFYTRIYNTTTGSVAIGEAGNGNNTVGGLTPGTNYAFRVELYNRAGNLIASNTITFMTNGISYLEGGTMTFTIGKPINFTVHTYNDSFVTRINVSCNNIVLQEIDVRSSGGLYSYNYTPTDSQIASIYASIPTALRTSGTIELTTYVNGSFIGIRGYFTFFEIDQISNAPTITSFDYIDTIPTAIDKTGNNKWVLQNISRLQIRDVVATAKNGASIATYRIGIGDTVVNSTTVPILVNSPIDSNVGIDLKVIDSRGLGTSKHIDFTRFVSYKSLYFNEISLTRVNDVEARTTLSIKGWFDRLPIDGVDKNTSIDFKYRYRQSDSTTWNPYTIKPVTISGNQFSYSNAIGDFDVDTSYIFEMLASDYYTSCINEELLMKGKFELFIGNGFVGINGELDLSNCKIRLGNNVFDAKLLLYDDKE